MDDDDRLSLWWRALVERFRSSLFGRPFLWIVGAIVGSRITVAIDRRLDNDDLPSFFDTTVESARALLGAIASGTIAAASVVFSLTLVAIQLASSAYSSRVLRTFLRDRFQQTMIGIVLSTFLFSVLILREVRAPLEESGEAFIPRLSVLTATVFALAALLALLASISHTAQSLRVSIVSRRLVADILETIDARFPEGGDGATATPVDAPSVAPDALVTADLLPGGETADVPTSQAVILTAAKGGWVQQIGLKTLARAAGDGTTVRLEVAVGTHVAAGSPLLTLWPAPPAGALPEDLADRLRASVVIGPERTLQQDVTFGLSLLEDIALRALSPGINDPNTARAVLPQLGEVLLALFCRAPSTDQVSVHGCRILRPIEPGDRVYVETAFDQLRVATRPQPAVQLALVRTLVSLREELLRRRVARPSTLEAIDAMLRRVAHDARQAHGREADELAELVDHTLAAGPVRP